MPWPHCRSTTRRRRSRHRCCCPCWLSSPWGSRRWWRASAPVRPRRTDHEGLLISRWRSGPAALEMGVPPLLEPPSAHRACRRYVPPFAASMRSADISPPITLNPANRQQFSRQTAFSGDLREAPASSPAAAASGGEGSGAPQPCRLPFLQPCAPVRHAFLCTPDSLAQTLLGLCCGRGTV